MRISDWSSDVCSSDLVVVAAFGWAASLAIPAAPATAPSLKVSWNFIGETGAILKHAASRRDIFLSILGISWFWLVGATFILLFPPYAKAVLRSEEHTSELQSLMRISYAVFCLKKKTLQK